MRTAARPDPDGFRELSTARRLRVLALAALQRRLEPSGSAIGSVGRALPASLLRPLRRALSPLRIAPLQFEADVPADSDFLKRSYESLPCSVSLLLPVHGNADLTLRCLRAVVAYSPPGMEIVVVDDASEDDTYERLAPYCRRLGMALHRNPGNIGFPATVNRAARLSKGKMLLILNSDVVVTPGWLNSLFEVFEREPRAGLVGPLGSDTGDVATFPASYGSADELDRLAASLTGRGVRKVGKLSLFCALLERDVFDRVGGLDERYDRGLFDDDDLCMALRACGRSILLCENVFVHHSAGSSFRRLSPLEYFARFEVNRARFESKWHVRWRAHVPD